MKFNEVIKEPEFTLTMTLKETIDLWKIVKSAADYMEEADKFVNALHNFASNSNSYTEYLE